MRSGSHLRCLRRICSRHIFERDADWQYGLDGDIQTRLFVDLMEAAHLDGNSRRAIPAYGKVRTRSDQRANRLRRRPEAR
jgi:hypothetical protein